MGNLWIVQTTNDDKSFYSVMGPYLSRREIVKELGYPVWDDQDKLWFVAKIDDKVAGFAAIRLDRKAAIFTSAWVKPDSRNQGIYNALTQARIEYVDAKHLTATTIATHTAVNTLLRFGFEEVRQTKNYVHMRREA